MEANDLPVMKRAGEMLKLVTDNNREKNDSWIRYTRMSFGYLQKAIRDKELDEL